MKEKKPIMFFLVLLFFTMLAVQSSVEYFQSDIYFVNLVWKNFISLGLSFLIGIPIASVIAYQRNK
jgi:hypothetical protein